MSMWRSLWRHLRMCDEEDLIYELGGLRRVLSGNIDIVTY